MLIATTTKEPTGPWRNQRGNQEILLDEWNRNFFFFNLWDVEKAILGGKFIAILAYSRKQETYQINNVILQQRN